MTKNFSDVEFACPCCGLLPDQSFQDIVQHLRNDYGKAVYLARCCSCAKHNRKIGGAKQSQHIAGEWNNGTCAIDVKQKTFHNAYDRAWFTICAIKNGFTCFGIGKRKYHADARPEYVNTFKIALMWGY